MSKHRALASRLFPPLRDGVRTKDDANQLLRSRSQRLFIDNNLIAPCGSGRFAMLPLLERSLSKLIAIIDDELQSIGAQKLQLPLLGDRKLWETTGRWSTMEEVLMKTKDRTDVECVLQPTFEESVTSLVAQLCPDDSMPAAALPLALYQIGPKFRDERQARFGLLRCKEFLMKDLYSFDKDDAGARETYERVRRCYTRIFTARLGLADTRAVNADCGDIGGTVSHEYHLHCQAGEDIIYYCEKCGEGMNNEIAPADAKCSSCNSILEPQKSIEIGHTFLLGQRYSKLFNANFKADPSSPSLPMSMGCFGIGVTRLLAAAVETLSVDNKSIRWPSAIVPYKLWLIPPKQGSKEEAAIGSLFDDFARLAHSALPSTLGNDTMLDDRTNLTVGRRLQTAKRLGIPLIVIGNKSLAVQPNDVPRLEVIDCLTNDTHFMTISEALHLLRSRT